MTATPVDRPHEEGAGAPRTRRRALLALAFAGVVSQALLVSSALDANPYARVPVLDGAHFWSWGGRIAGGELVGDTPFFSAPLYPYLVGLVRALGGGLSALYALQGALVVGAALLTAVAADRWQRASGGGSRPAAAGSVAGLLVLLVSDVGLSSARVLAGPLQLLLVALVLERASRLAGSRSRGTARSAWPLGVAAGLTALAWPPMLLALPLLGLWCAAVATRRAGLAAFGASVAMVLPATAHNVAACGEWIPISAHAGVTFWHGNNPAAQGTFAAVDVVNDKDTYHLDALRQARESLGADAGWSDASRHFFGKGLEWWGDEPRRASTVALRKLWYALSGRHYGDIYTTTLERRDGLLPRGWLAPLPLAVLVPFGVVASFVLARGSRRRAFPLLLMVGLPLAVCVVFWYSPRYRLPAAPAICCASALALARLTSGAVRPAGAVLLGLAAVVGLASGALNRALDFDAAADVDRLHLERTATVLGGEGRHEAAADFMRRALDAAPGDADLRRRTFDLLRWLGREAEAVELLRLAPDEVARDAGYRAFLAWTLATSPDASARDGRRALELAQELVEEDEGRDPVTLDALGAAYAECARFPAALEAVDRAMTWVGSADPYRAELMERRVGYRDRRPWRESPVTRDAQPPSPQ